MLGLREVAAIQKGPRPKEGITIGLIDRGVVRVLSDIQAPARPGKLVRVSAAWA